MASGTWRAAVESRLRRHGLLLVLLVTALACLPALGNGYAQDGKLLVMVEGNDRPPNPMVAELRPLREYFQSPYWRGAGESAELYRPLTVMSFALVRHGLGRPLGNDALLQHLTDVLLHLLAVALTWRLLLTLSISARAACAGALVFGLHALHAEVIASIVGRAELLAFAGGAAGWLLGQRAWTSAGWRHTAWALASASCFFAAFAAKESGLAWLAFAPLLSLACARHGWRGPLLGTVACTLPAAVVFLALRAAALAGGGSAAVPHNVNPLFDAEVMVRLATATVVWVHGLWKLVAPFWLVSDYGGQTFALRSSFLDPAVVGAALVLLAMAACSLWALRRAPVLGLAGACFLGFSLVTANLVFPIGTVFAERLYYTPSLAAAMAVAWLVERRAATRVLPLLLGSWLLASAWTLADRLGDWRDDSTLLLRDVARNPKATRLHTGAAEMLWARGELAAACAHTREALQLDPDFAGAWSNLGCLLLEQQAAADAEAALRHGLRASRINPIEARLLHLNLGRALLAQSRPAEALTELQEARRLMPDAPLTLWFTLEAAAQLERDDLAQELVAAGERVAPGEPRWALHRGLLALHRGDAVAAERELRAAIAGGVDDVRSRKALEQALALPRSHGR